MNHIAFVQGRLVNKVDNKIQAFPRDDWEKELELASKHKINFIELTVDLNRIWENPVASSLGVIKLKNKLSLCGIKVLACTADFIMHNPPWKSNSEDMVLITKKVIQGLGKIGCKLIVIPFVDDSSILKGYEDDALKFLMSLESCLEKSGVEVAIESDYKPKNLLKFMKRMPSNLYGINYDIGNSASLGYDVGEEFALYFNRIKHIHIKDRVFKGTTVPLGEGDADLTLCFNLLKKYNYKGNFSMQTARDDSDNHIEVMLKYISMVNKNINDNY